MASAVESSTAPVPDRWTVKFSSGQSYGPVGKSQLDTWVSEGRVTGDCQLSRAGQPGWLWARDVYPLLASARGAVTQPYVSQSPSDRDASKIAEAAVHDSSTSPNLGDPAAGANPYSSPASANPGYYGERAGYLKPHRGGLILTLGILGLVLCHFLGIPAWIMGSADLKEIRAGRMDPAGQGLTQAGMIIGIIACVFMVIGFAFMAVWIPFVIHKH
jgi:GYF domain 2